MKGLTYCWFVSNKSYFTVAVIVLAAALGLIFGVLPNLDAVPLEIKHLVVFVLSAAVMAIPTESLTKNLESYIKTDFADYLLSAMDKRSFVNSLVLRELICFGFSLIGGYTVICSYLLSLNLYFTAEPMIFVLFLAVLMSGVDLICMPPVIKFRNAEKAGLITGLFFGFLMLCFVLYMRITRGENGFTDIILNMDFSPKGMFIIMGVMLAASVIAYLITLKMVKRGDVC